MSGLAVTDEILGAIVIRPDFVRSDASGVAGDAEVARALAPPKIGVPADPLEGYAIHDTGDIPGTSVADFRRKVVHAWLHEQLCVAGMRDIVGCDDGISERQCVIQTGDFEPARCAPGSKDAFRRRPNECPAPGLSTTDSIAHRAQSRNGRGQSTGAGMI